MLTTIFSNTIGQTLTVVNTLIIVCAALILGAAISIFYMQVHKKSGYSKSYVMTLVMLPAIISIIILLVGNNVARAFSLAGAFSLIRFRSAPGDAKDIAYVFFTLGVGLACGMGYVAYAVLFTIVLCLAMFILEKVKFGSKCDNRLKLKVTMPEDMEYQDIFDNILTEYTNTYKLTKVKTTEFGSLYELTYEITLKENANTKEMIDKIRQKNGNLNIVLANAEKNEAVAI